MMFIGYSKDEIDEMSEFEPLRKMLALRALIEMLFGGLFGGGGEQQQSSGTHMPFSNMPPGYDIYAGT